MADPIIFHVDVNSAFLSWEACRRLTLDPDSVDIRTLTAVIGGDESKRHGIVLAKSTSAKRYGIQTGEALALARRKCPSLEVFSPHFDCFVQYSDALMALLRSYAPEVEQFSIDEAYCDFTGTETLYGDLIAFAHRLKDEIHEKLGFTVNIGISTNKLLAKMASDFEKPDKVHTLFPDEVPAKMWPLPVSDLLYVGKGSVKKLNLLGIFTIGDLAAYDPALLHTHLGKHGDAIWEFANGRDVSTITSKPAEVKGFGNSTTLSRDVSTREEAYVILLSLCETVSSRIRKAGAHINVVTVSIMDTEFNRSSHQMRLTNMTNITEEIYEHACRLFDEKWDGSPIRLLGVSTDKADEDSFIQYSLFDNGKNERLQKLNSAIDQIRERYGENSIKRARFLDSSQSHMTDGMNKAKRTGGKSE